MSRSALAYRLAAGLALLGALAHEVLGAPMVLPPLSAGDLPADVIWLHHFSWHVGTVAVLGMAVLFVLAARSPENRPMAVVATGMSAGFAMLGVGLALLGDPVMWTTPAPYVWSLIALIGVIGILPGRAQST